MNIYVSQIVSQTLQCCLMILSIVDAKQFVGFSALEKTSRIISNFCIVISPFSIFYQLNFSKNYALINPFIFLFFFSFSCHGPHSLNLTGHCVRSGGNTLDRSQVYHRAHISKRDKQTFTLSPKPSLELSICLTCMFLVY